MMDHRIFRIPVLGWLFRLAKAIPARRRRKTRTHAAAFEACRPGAGARATCWASSPKAASPATASCSPSRAASMKMSDEHAPNDERSARNHEAGPTDPGTLPQPDWPRLPRRRRPPPAAAAADQRRPRAGESSPAWAAGFGLARRVAARMGVASLTDKGAHER